MLPRVKNPTINAKILRPETGKEINKERLRKAVDKPLHRAFRIVFFFFAFCSFYKEFPLIIMSTKCWGLATMIVTFSFSYLLNS
ncbi:MAG: hypothetical protein Sup05_0842 [uncultured Candidatus Thioglobus sp.]|nr:MAG: hypothetical protein Sup05_0842 [uncultured Candidatus Thioglobus sp.]